jgi:pimeloyl-ACP methyl ester carboxylesterase
MDGLVLAADDHVTALIVLLGAALHSGFVGLGFVIHWYEAQTRGAARRPVVYLRAYLVEWWMTLGVILAWPLGWLPPLPRRFDSAGGPPILLVHGYMMNRSSMFGLYWRLQRAGFRNIYTVNLPTTLGIRAAARRFIAEVRDLAALTRGTPVVVVAHSMGGIVARFAAAHEPALPLDRIVTFCTPHKGTRMAVFGLDPSAVELRVGSAVLAALPERARVPVASIWAGIDNIVVPSDSAAFGARATELPDAGHMTPLFEARAFRALLLALPPLATPAAVTSSHVA